jgi:hypothetical protein
VVQGGAGCSYTTDPSKRTFLPDGGAGTVGGPALQPNAIRSFLVTGTCNIPTSAQALSVNITVTQPTASGSLRLYPGDLASPPVFSSINFSAGQTRGNNGMLKLSPTGTVKVKADTEGTVQFILDVNGYFQ